MARRTSVFGESIISMSPFSTPVAGRPSNQFNQASTTLDNHGKEVDNELRRRSGTAQEARDDEEAGYARLEDIFSGQSGQASTQSR